MYIPVPRYFLPCLSFARYVVQRFLGWELEQKAAGISCGFCISATIATLIA
jgi:hypothetical protein